MRARSILTVIALSILTLPPAGIALLQPAGSKSETIYYKMSPKGELTPGSVEVLLRIGSSSEGESVTIVDRVYMADAGSVSPLLGSLPPSRIESFYGHLILYWENVPLSPEEELEIRYSTQTSAPPPMGVNLTMLVNGEPASLVEFNGDYFLEIERGDLLSLTFTLYNARHSVRTSVGEGRPPLVYTLQVSLPKSHFSEPTGSPEPSMTLPTTDDWMLSWMGVLWDEPITISLSARVRATAPEGFVELPSVTVQASLDTGSIAKQLRDAVESYQDALEALREMNDSLSEALSGMETMANWLGEGRAKALEASEGLLGLASALETASESASEAAETAEKAAKEVESTVSGAQEALASLDSIENSLEEFYESYENLTDVLSELLEELGISLNLTPPGVPPPGGYSPVIERVRSQLTSAIAKGQMAANMLYGLAYAMENASASGEVAAEQAREAAKELEGLGEALAMAEYAARSGIEAAQSGLEELKSRIAEAESELNRAMLRAELASYREPLTGVCEIDAGEHALLTAKPELLELDGGWAIESLSLTEAEGVRVLGAIVPLSCSQDPPTVLLEEEGSWREHELNDLTGVGVLYLPDSCAIYLRVDANVTDGKVNLSIGGIPIRLLVSKIPEQDALLDASIGQELETNSRVVIKLALPTLSVGIPVGVEEELRPTQAPSPPEEGASRWRRLHLVVAAIAVTSTVAIYSTHRERSEEKAALLARISEMAAQLDELEAELMEKLREESEE